ncbi:MarR family transcriptional regulator [Prescottella equi]|uniref:MarR family winged helix-turn-helix transcriptional regulator n=1 Tax=Rhodococcus hoagii TaxID=43767 RepID=UPI0009C17102|nr:MarR family transcriptional regulator [Prescottella equi]OQQ30799.1 MarR family transcriptional regulator [Prescottella equi]OQQ36444.1 MarR family transcriptional regulator [Prescottella equi]WQB74768.1 MarR family transcriptional regulator [Prescottella equi]
MTHSRDDDAMALVHRVRALTVELNLLGAEFANRNGLHTTDLRALICLLDAARSGTPSTPGWLGGQLSLSSASTTALIDRLETAGLLERGRDTADRRRVLVTVTPKAEELGWSFFGPLIGRAVRAIETFSHEERETVSAFFTRMREAAADARTELAPDR